MVYEKQSNEIRAHCKELLEQDKVDVVLGYTPGSLDGTLIPYFARRPEDADHLAWGDRCWQNLAAYLHGRNDRIGIVAKPCDVRAIVQYIIEGQLSREKVYIIGLDCRGMVDEEGDPRPGCNDCRVKKPPIFDMHIVDEHVVDTNGKSSEEDFSPDRFDREIDKCILCYSCRQACYACYCQSCFVERGNPDWLPADVDSATKKTFHLGRAMHLAGRCVECGGCEAACASGVELRYIVNELTGFVEDNYEFKAGMDLSAKQPLQCYADSDIEIGFLGGENT